jgi:hypothetical protein
MHRWLTRPYLRHEHYPKLAQGTIQRHHQCPNGKVQQSTEIKPHSAQDTAQDTQGHELDVSFEQLNIALYRQREKKELPTCPYHRPIVDMVPTRHQRDTSPMSRFLEEGPSERSALTIRGDTGKISSYRCCTCLMDVEVRR